MKNLRLLLIPLLSFFIITASYGQSIIYVDSAATAFGDGSSWSNAIPNLQAAIDSSQSGDSIWVKKGTYKPTKTLSGSISLSGRPKTFILKSGIAIYGGFDGTESNLAQRTANPLDSNLTILSGDFGTPNDSSDNSFHVMSGIEVKNITINGLSIRYGNADDTTAETVGNRSIKRSYGGGLFLDSCSSVKLHHIEFKNNYAVKGGAGLNIENSSLIGIENAFFTANIIDAQALPNGSEDGGAGIRSYNTNPLIKQSHFTENSCYDCQGGGAMRNINSNAVVDSSFFTKNFVDGNDGGGAVYNYKSDPSFTTVRFDTNTTPQEAGAVYNDSSNPSFTDVSFTFNSGGSGGGGAMENDAGTATLVNVIFKNNSSQGDGGAIQNWKSDIDLTEVIFEGNQALGNGGAITNYNNCTSTMNKVTFKNNSSGGNGGALYNLRESEAIITNGLFYGNHADIRGGAIHTEAYSSWQGAIPSSVILTNVTITKNSADTSGGGGYDDGVGNSKLRNSIIYGNTALNNADVDAPASMIGSAVSHSIIGNDRYTSGTAAPISFSHIHFKDSVNNNFQLDSLSPAIDNGDSSFYDTSATPDLSSINTDLRGVDRMMGNNVDIGAYERCNNIIAVSATIAYSQNGNNIDFIATPTPSSAGFNLSYKWYINNVLVPGVSGTQYSATAGVDVSNNDWVAVGVYSNDPCTKSGHQDSIQVVITGLENNVKAENSFKLYPNPSNGTFTLKYQSATERVLTYRIQDITGKEIYRAEGQNTKSAKAKVFNLDLSKGLYFFTITHENGEKESRKFIVR